MIGAVYFVGKLGVVGRWKLIVSLLIGLLLGGGYQLSQDIPNTYAGWFAVVIYGLAMGLFASGLFDLSKETVQKIIVKVLESFAHRFEQ